MNMKKSLSFMLACSVLIAADSSASKQPQKVVRPPEIVLSTKEVSYGDKDVVMIRTKIRYTTLIKLPPSEKIVDFTCGDKDFWVINGAENIAHVKPAKVGSSTNLNLITGSGNIYSFALTEISEDPLAQPDLKVFITPNDESMIKAAKTSPRFVSVKELEDAKQQTAKAEEDTKRAKEQTQTAIDTGISAFIKNVRFPYRFESGKKPFSVRAMYTDDKFTYIQARPEEPPAIYEMKDGKPNLVNFEYRNGMYTINKILGDGYLAIGKQKLAFSRQD